MKRNNMNEGLSKEEEEDILAITDDIEMFEDEPIQPIPKQDYTTKKAANKKLGLKDYSSKFNPPSYNGLLPTPSILLPLFAPPITLLICFLSLLFQGLLAYLTPSFFFSLLYNLRLQHTYLAETNGGNGIKQPTSRHHSRHHHHHQHLSISQPSSLRIICQVTWKTG